MLQCYNTIRPTAYFTIAYGLFHYCLPPIALLPTADCRLPTEDCRLPTADCRLPTGLLPIALIVKYLPDDLRNVFAKDIKLNGDDVARLDLVEVCDFPGKWDDGNFK